MDLHHFGFMRRALQLAVLSHADQKRKYTGEPYVTHSIQVAALVANFGGTPDMVRAALLHDVLEDTLTPYAVVEDCLGRIPAGWVQQLTDERAVLPAGAPTPPNMNRAARKHRDRVRLAACGYEVQTIKCCDLIDNTATIARYDPGFAKVYLPEKLALLDVLTKAEPVAHAAAMDTWRKAMDELEQGPAGEDPPTVTAGPGYLWLHERHA